MLSKLNETQKFKYLTVSLKWGAQCVTYLMNTMKDNREQRDESFVNGKGGSRDGGEKGKGNGGYELSFCNHACIDCIDTLFSYFG